MTMCRGLVLGGLLCLAPLGRAWAESYESVIRASQAGESEKRLLRQVEHAEFGYTLSREQAKECEQAGVPWSVIQAMVRNPARSRGGLDQVVYQGYGITITLWKLLAYLGTLIFAGRWLVQMFASRKAGRPVTTVWFWIMSLVGSAFCLSYWIFGPKQDSVGVLQNLFPTFVAGYNLYLEVRYYRINGVPAHQHGEVRVKAAEPEAVEAAAGE